jgi:hypothetical protein
MSTSDLRSRRRRSPGQHKNAAEARRSSSDNAVVGIPSDLYPVGLNEDTRRSTNSPASLPSKPGAYELLLRFGDGRDEFVLTDHLDFFAREPHTLEFSGQRWQITVIEPPSQSGFIARLVCQPALAPPRAVASPLVFADGASDALSRRSVLAAEECQAIVVQPRRLAVAPSARPTPRTVPNSSP